MEERLVNSTRKCSTRKHLNSHLSQKLQHGQVGNFIFGKRREVSVRSDVTLKIFDGIEKKGQQPNNAIWQVKTPRIGSEQKSFVGDLFAEGMGVADNGSNTSRIQGKQRDYERYDGSNWKNSKIKYNLNHEIRSKSPNRQQGIKMVDKSKLLNYVTNK